MTKALKIPQRANKPKVLFLDVESLPNISYGFNLYDYTKPNMIIKEGTIISFAWKWAGEKSVQVKTVYDFQCTKKDPYNDKGLMEFISGIINEADYVVGHYSDKFDMRKIRMRLAVNGLPSLGPVSTIDTYKLAKKYFLFNANRLDYLGKLLGCGGKISTNWQLWEDCAKGDEKAMQKMADYNKRDVDLLEKVFHKLLPYCSTNLNQKLFSDKEGPICETCGSSNLQKRGTVVNRVTKKQRLYCKDCGSWHSVKITKEA